MESTENGVQAEKKEAAKDDSEQVKAEVAPAEKVEKVEKTEETKAEEAKAEAKVEKAEKTEEKAEEPPKKAEEPPKKAEEPPKKTEEPPKKTEEPPKKAEEPAKVEEQKVEEVKKEEEKVEEKVEETKKSDEKVEEVKETEKVEETVEEVVEEEEEEVVEEIVEEEESKEKVEKTETVEKDESSKAKEESEPTEKEEAKEPQQEVAPAKAEAKADSDSGSDEELIIEEEEVDEDEEDEEETKEVVIIRRPAAKEAETKEAAEPKKEVAVTNGEAEEEEVEALTVKLHSKVKVEDEKTESAEPEKKEESPKKPAEPEPVAKAEPKAEAPPVREQPAYEPTQPDYSSRPFTYENRDVPQVKRDFSQYDRDVPRVERDYPPHIYTGHKYSYLDRETPRVQREEPPRFRQEYPSQFQATTYGSWPSKQSHVSYETQEITETVRETSGAGPMRREIYDERCVRQEYKSRDGSSQGPKQVDLQKIFTPATDAEEIMPKNRKLYASSAFYSPGLHPTVEDQVELARKISHSLSDSNNQQSKGQSMYVNRKKRSVKWVHEGEGTATIAHEYNEESKENNFENRVSSRSFEKVPLKLVMDPRGQVKTPSYNDYNIDAGMQSPEICADIMKSLHAPKGKGAELFAKRRKKSENWIVDETNTSNSSSQGLHETTYGQATGIPSTGPQDYSSYDQYQYSQSPYAAQKTSLKSEPYEKVSSYTTKTESSVYSTTRDLAYKPSIPRGWNAPAPSLPKNLYTPPGIPLDSYAPPPEVSVPSPTQPSWAASSSLHTSQSPYYPSPSSYTAEPVSSEPTYSSPTKQPGYYSPSKSPYSPSLAQGYKRPQPTGGSFSPPQSNIQHATPSITFNPSPLPYEKLEKFDRPSTPPSYTPYTYRGTKSPVVSSFPKSQPTYKPQPKYEQPKYEAPKYDTPSYDTPKYEPPKNGYSTTPTYPSKSPVYPSFPSEIPVCSRVSPGEVMRGPTFNTAPRGWNQMRDYYRPVTLDDPKQYSHMSYTDF